MLHPALPSCPGHDLWRRDFTGSASVFSVVFQPAYSREAVTAFVDRLTLFGVGYSWGGVTSLAAPQFDLAREHPSVNGPLVRFNVGLESADDLIADLEQALAGLEGAEC